MIQLENSFPEFEKGPPIGGLSGMRIFYRHRIRAAAFLDRPSYCGFSRFLKTRSVDFRRTKHCTVEVAVSEVPATLAASRRA